jgi:hypothetical protein
LSWNGTRGPRSMLSCAFISLSYCSPYVCPCAVSSCFSCVLWFPQRCLTPSDWSNGRRAVDSCRSFTCTFITAGRFHSRCFPVSSRSPDGSHPSRQNRRPHCTNTPFSAQNPQFPPVRKCPKSPQISLLSIIS